MYCDKWILHDFVACCVGSLVVDVLISWMVRPWMVDLLICLHVRSFSNVMIVGLVWFAWLLAGRCVGKLSGWL